MITKSSSYWSQVPLYELCNPKQWPTIPQTEFVDHGYAVYGANGKIGYYNKYNHEKPTILITCRGATCGTINICEPKSYVTGNAMALDGLDEGKVTVEYLVYALRQGILAKAITGTAQPQITRQSLTAISIPLPPLAEQRRIAEILDRAEALRAKRHATLAQLDALTQATFLDLFGDPVRNPKSWPYVSFGELGENQDSQRIPVRATDRENRRGKFPYYGASGIIDWVDQYLFDGDRLLIAEDGANLVARVTPVAFIASGRYWVNNHAHVIASNGRAELRFLEYFIEHLDLNPYISGTAQPKLNQSNLERISVPLPPLALQREFVGYLGVIGKLRTTCSDSLASLDTLFASLQHRAFRGEL